MVATPATNSGSVLTQLQLWRKRSRAGASLIADRRAHSPPPTARETLVVSSPEQSTAFLADQGFTMPACWSRPA